MVGLASPSCGRKALSHITELNKESPRYVYACVTCVMDLAELLCLYNVCAVASLLLIELVHYFRITSNTT